MSAARTNARELRVATTLSGVVALRMMGLFLILPVFMVLAVNIPGYSPAAAGLAVGIYGLTQAALQQPFGWLSDRWGRKPVLLLGLGLFAIGGVIAALADSMQLLILGRALQGCGAIAGVALALAADVTKPERRSVVMAILGIGIGAAFLLSMMLSVPLATLLGLKGLFWLTAVFALVGMALVMTVPHARGSTSDPVVPADPDRRPVWLLGLSVFLLHAVMTLLFVAFPPMLVEEYGLELPAHWRVYVPTMLLSVAIAIPVLRMIGREFLEHRILHWAFLALGAALGSLSLGVGWLVTGVLITLYFVGFNLLESAMPALLSRVTASSGRGRRMGLYSTFQFLGAFAGGVVGGVLLGSFGSEAALLIAGAICLAWGLVIKVLWERFFLTRVAA